MVSGTAYLYVDVMASAHLTSRRFGVVVRSLWSAPAWRATRSDLAALGVALVGIVLLGGLGVLWTAALLSLLDGAGTGRTSWRTSSWS